MKTCGLEASGLADNHLLRSLHYRVPKPPARREAGYSPDSDGRGTTFRRTGCRGHAGDDNHALWPACLQRPDAGGHQVPPRPRRGVLAAPGEPEVSVEEVQCRDRRETTGMGQSGEYPSS